MAATWGAAAPSPRSPARLVAEIRHEVDAADRRPGPASVDVLEEAGREVFHRVVVGGADDVVVEAVEARLPQRLVVHAIGVDLVERDAPALEEIFRGVGRRRG